MATIRFALEWPRQDLEHIWRALLATEIHVTRPCPVTRVLLVEWRRLRELHHRGQLSAAAVARELQTFGEAALARKVH